MTKIEAAYRRWSELWRSFPTDEECAAAGAAREPLEQIIMGEPATCVADVICKLEIAHAHSEGGKWHPIRDVLGAAIGDLRRLAGSAK
jgi:hypothetical protein